MNPRSRPADLATLPLEFPDPTPEASGAPPEPTPAAGTANPWDHCPNCGGTLHNERCKRRCSRCHYFMSCSDFD
ncbi:hypothetical protein [Rubricoccus marinus]|uniref:hypothetical protein n=1 Tax=Rubricoccus marinus TaxID=716817 RepID=UPI001179DEE6|nr:hypothetical protein [Rubricoccus marinus]